jgi:phage/plasmid-like protein (TIGR03299 family)
MAHNVYEINGQASMAYSGRTPWHGLGQHIDPDATIEEWRRQAQLDWEVLQTPVIFNRGISMERPELHDALGLTGEAGEPLYFEGQKILYRSDDGQPLSVVTDGYKIVQPSQVLEFFRTLVECHGYKIVTAGSLRGGNRVWALASVNLEAQIGRSGSADRIKPYVLLVTSYDRSLATTAQFTSVEVVCDNTLTYAYQGGVAEEAAERKAPQKFRNVVRIPHLTEMNDAKVAEVQEKLGLASAAFYEFADFIDNLSERKITEDDAKKFFLDLLHDPQLGDDFSDVSPRICKRLAETYINGQGQDLETRRGTAWGLVGAVSRYVDHERRYRNADTRFDSATFNDGATMKRKALALAGDLLGD